MRVPRRAHLGSVPLAALYATPQAPLAGIGSGYSDPAPSRTCERMDAVDYISLRLRTSLRCVHDIQNPFRILLNLTYPWKAQIVRRVIPPFRGTREHLPLHASTPRCDPLPHPTSVFPSTTPRLDVNRCPPHFRVPLHASMPRCESPPKPQGPRTISSRSPSVAPCGCPSIPLPASLNAPKGDGATDPQGPLPHGPRIPTRCPGPRHGPSPQSAAAACTDRPALS